MIRCIAIDDEPLALAQLVAYINKVPFLELAAQCQSALDARAFLQEETADVIFCDINMPDLNGMDFVRSLQAPPFVVFTTAYSEYAIEGYKVDAIDYLLKPFGLDDFRRAANKVKAQYDLTHASEPSTLHPSPSALHNPPSALFVKTDYRIVKINIADIRYIEGMSEYLRIWLDGQPKPIVTLLSMKKMEERLPDTFMRIHRSYIVNLEKVEEVNKSRVILDADTNLPVGDMYKEAFNRYIESQFLGK